MTDPQTPATEAGRRLLLDIERVVWAPIPGSHDVWAADILAIEAEARASLDVLARALHDQRQVQSFAGCGWMFGSVVDGEVLCPCPADAADLLHRMEIGS